MSNPPQRVRTQPAIGTPEDLIDTGKAGRPLSLTLECRACGTTSTEEFEWACVHPKLEACKKDGWDGIGLSRIVTCSKCGAIDDYCLAGKSMLALTSRLVGLLVSAPRDRIVVGEMRMWDGAVARRPAQALSLLRELARTHPTVAKGGVEGEREGECRRRGGAFTVSFESDAICSLPAAEGFPP